MLAEVGSERNAKRILSRIRMADGDRSRVAAVKVINPSHSSTILTADTTCGVSSTLHPRVRVGTGLGRAVGSPGCVGTAFPFVHFGLLVSAGIGALTKSCRDRNFEGCVSYVSDRKELFSNLRKKAHVSPEFWAYDARVATRYRDTYSVGFTSLENIPCKLFSPPMADERGGIFSADVIDISIHSKQRCSSFDPISLETITDGLSNLM